MKKKVQLMLLFIVGMMNNVSADVHHAYLNDSNDAEFINICTGIDDTLIMHKPLIAGTTMIVWVDPESNQFWDQDTVIVTYTMQGNWYFSSPEVGKDIYVYFLPGPPSQPSCLHDSTFVCDQPIDWLVDAENLTSGYSCTYLWSNGATTQTTIITTEGNHWVQITNDCGTETFLFTVSIDRPTIDVVGNDTVCAGESVTLVASGNASSYVWEGSYTNPYSVTPTVTTSYSVVGTNTQGCTDTMQVTVVVHNLPNTPVITLSGVDTLISDAPTGNQWYNQTTGLINGAEGQEYVVTETGSYFCIVTNEYGCISDTSDTLHVVITRIQELMSEHMVVFPNPVKEHMYIQTDDKKICYIEIRNLLGQIVLSGYAIDMLDVHSLYPGNYIISIVAEGRKSNIRFTKEGYKPFQLFTGRFFYGESV